MVRVKFKIVVTVIGIALGVLAVAVVAIVWSLIENSDNKNEESVSPTNSPQTTTNGSPTTTNESPTTTITTTTTTIRTPLVMTHCGEVEGKNYTVLTDTKQGKLIYEYKNIPYAAPPIGERRWRPPQALSKENSTCWNEVLKYSNTTVKCMQKVGSVASVSGQEDCLVLNVRSPTLNKDSLLPVLVWFHGGGLLWGYNDAPGYHPTNEFTASLEVVTVSVNYRLNALGFLSLEELWIDSGTDESYGNYGIMDMIMSLKWIKQNIRNFGGDPNQVIIFGESGGATGVYSLLASNPAQGLFHKAIAASGTPNIRMDHNQANAIFRSFLNRTNCTQKSSSEVRRCLLELDATTVTENAPWFQQAPGLPPSFTLAHVALVSYKYGFPVNIPTPKLPIEIIDPVVIQRSPDQINSSGNALKVDVALSNLAQEIPITPPDVVTDFKTLNMSLAPKISTFKNASYDQIFALYNKNTITRPANQTSDYFYTTMATDVRMSCSVNDLSDHLSSLSDYYNVYRFVISQPPSPINGVTQKAYHEWDTSVLFGFKRTTGFEPSSDELKLMVNLRQFYKNFLYLTSNFSSKYQNETTIFWNNTVEVYKQKYHEKMCTFWRDNGFLKYSWGNTGL